MQIKCYPTERVRVSVDLATEVGGKQLPFLPRVFRQSPISATSPLKSNFPAVSAAIAIASVPDQRHYDTNQERYMGLPSGNVDGYRDGSPINFAHQLEGDHLIVHGSNEENGPSQTFGKRVDKLFSTIRRSNRSLR